MAPEEAVQNIKNLEHCSLLECYKLFDKYLKENKVERPVVVLSDGHTSRFDFDVMQFLHDNDMRLFLTPPDTTGSYF